MQSFYEDWLKVFIKLLIQAVVQLSFMKFVLKHFVKLTPKHFWQRPFSLHTTFSKVTCLFWRRDHSFNTFPKFSEKLGFLSSWYANVSVCIRGAEKLVFQKILWNVLNEWFRITKKRQISLLMPYTWER